MGYAPDVITQFNQQQEPQNVNNYLNQQQVIQLVPVRGQLIQYSVPNPQMHRGWISPDVPNNAPLWYEEPRYAPPVMYSNLSYSNLILQSAQITGQINRPAVNVTAPAIQTG